MFWTIVWVLLFILFIIVLFKRIRPWWKKIVTLLLIFVVSLFAAFKTLVPLNPPLATSGPNQVDYHYIYYSHDTEYPDMATQGNQREIPVAIWQPETLEEGQHPLLVFSHGSFGTAESNESLFRELASHGYIVASLGHPYHSFSTTLSDGKEVSIDMDFLNSVLSAQGSQNLQGTLDDFEDWLGIRREDLNFVLDSMLSEDSEWAPYIQKDKVVLSGHSLGATLVLEIGRQRADELAGIIALEGPFVGDITGVEGDEYVFTPEEYPLPILHFYSDALYDRLGEITTYHRNQEYIDLNSPKFVNAHIEGSGHIGLTDLSLVSPFLTEVLDRMTGGASNSKPVDVKLKEINEISLDFLENLD